MDIEIITQPLQLTIYGFGSTAINQDYVGTAFKLSGKMWDTVKAAGIKNKGQNIWVYDAGHKVFAGVELNDDAAASNSGLEHITLQLNKYARYKHVGPYQLIKQSGQQMNAELKAKGFEVQMTYIEIYGHWTNDESKLETTLLMNLK